jgi:hypothetical protein
MTSLFLALSASFSHIFTKNLKNRVFYAIDMTKVPPGFWHRVFPRRVQHGRGRNQER